MIVCRNCGHQNQPTDEFCASCGTFLEWSGADTPPDGTAGTTGGTAAGPGGATDPVPTGGSQPDYDGTQATGGAPPGYGAPTPPGRPPAGQPRPADAAMRVPSTAPPRPGLIRCDTCGTANSPTRAFCQRCGSALPRVGAAPPGGTGRVVRPINPAFLLGSVALVGLVALGGFLVYTGALSGPGASPTPSGTIVASSPGPSRSPSAAPTTTASATAPPNASPTSASPTSAGPTSSPRPRFACETTKVSDRSDALWTIRRATWGRQGRADVLTLALERTGTRDRGRATLTAELVPFVQLFGRGLERPPEGEVAIVLTFRGVRLGSTLEAAPDMEALRALRFEQDGNRVVGVLGVAGRGCFGLVASDWTPDPPATVELRVEIRNR